MTITRIKDPSLIYSNIQIVNLLKQTIHLGTTGKIQSIAEAVYGKTQGVFYICKDDKEQIIAIAGGSMINRDKIILKHLAYDLENTNNPLKLFHQLFSTMQNEAGIVTLEMVCNPNFQSYLDKLFLSLSFKKTKYFNDILDQVEIRYTMDKRLN